MNKKQQIKNSVKRIGVLVMAILIFSSTTTYAQPWLHTESSSTNVASGVLHQRILRFGESGWQQINVVRVDLRDENNKIKLIHSDNGVSSRDTLTNMMNRLASPVAGINADFFHLTQPDSPLGIMINDGQLISSPVFDRPFSTLRVTNDGVADLVNWTNHSYVSTQSGNLFSVEAYNKITWNFHKITLLDSNWGNMTPGAAGEYRDLVEVIVVDGIVQEVRRGLPGREIPANGFVLLASGQRGERLFSGLRQGESVTFHPQMFPRLEDTALAVGGGTILVQNGQVVPFSEPVAGNHPRTAVGISRSGTELIFVTVDGRHRSFTGVDGQRLASIMIELGSQKAILMDGGGSTTMAVRPLGQDKITVTNQPSDGSQRRIINGLAVVSTAPLGNLQGLLFTDEQKKAFINHPIELSVVGYDQHYQPYPLSGNQVSYRVVQGNGRIDSGRIIPTAAGTLVVEASAGGVSATSEIRVLETVSALQIHVPKYSVNPGESLPLVVEGIDSNGYRAPLNLQQLQMTDANGLGQFTQGMYQAGQRAGTTILRASYNGFHAAIPISVGQRRESAGSLAQFAPSFLGYPSQVQGSVRLVPEGTDRPNVIQLDYDLTRVLGTAAAYVVFGERGIPVPAGTTRISLDARSVNTAPHWIRGQLRDGNGQTHIVDLKQGIDWTGWRNLEGAVPTNLTTPVTLERIYVVETDPVFKTRGTLWFDNISFLIPHALPILTQQEKGGTVSDVFGKTPAGSDQQWLVNVVPGRSPSVVRRDNGSKLFGDSQRHGIVNQGDVTMITLDNSNDGLRRTNFQQWPWLMNAVKDIAATNVVLLMPKPVSGPEGFTDELEADLFINVLEQLGNQGKNVYVFHGSENEGFELNNGVRFIGLGKNTASAVQLTLWQGSLYYVRVGAGGAAIIPATPSPGGENIVAFRVGQRHYTVNGQKISLDAAPYIRDSRLMIPVSHASNALGISKDAVEWDEVSQTVLIRAREGRTLLLTIGSDQLWLDNTPVTMDAVAEITNNRTFIPISWFAKALGVEFTWHPGTETVEFR